MIFLAVYSVIQMLESVKRIYKYPQDVEFPDVPKPGRSVPGPRGAVVSAQFYAAHLCSDHGLINYRDTKAKCCHLKKLPVKVLCGRCLSEFIGWRYSQSYWYFRPSFVNCCPSKLLFDSTLPPLTPSMCQSTVKQTS